MPNFIHILNMNMILEDLLNIPVRLLFEWILLLSIFIDYPITVGLFISEGTMSSVKLCAIRMKFLCSKYKYNVYDRCLFQIKNDCLL